jgi:glucosyl-3-phosphoglycerate synthase
VLPTREVAATIGTIVGRLRELGPLIDQILVVDAASQDGTAEIAAEQGVPEFGPVLGKGDAMWRAPAVARGELIAYLDSDTRDFSPHFATGLLDPLICEHETRFVKGHFTRPFTSADGELRPHGGGRVTELTARPLLSAFFPDVAEFAQPLKQLGRMASEVLGAVVERLRAEGRLADDHARTPVERPPYATLGAPA